ncbi:hypothetical protein [Rudanella lutea]|uniref:hypothetical protein n=1 Tax=Rudanella lutea TaxID=451374 RepID=UPI000363E071|nr:hypothetical protein [Rudanella lutea]
MAISEKPFASCTLKSVDKQFRTRRTEQLPSLTDWLNRPAEISNFEREALMRFQRGLNFNVHDWNEHELDTHFIGPIFALIDFSTLAFNHFSQRDIEATVDGMVASSYREPEQPFFVFQDYKLNLDSDDCPAHVDPAGQCLAAMLAGQMLNPSPDLPVYGCNVMGSLWQFMTLEDRQYATSPGYSATSDDLFDVVRILKTLKQIVAERVAAVNP